VALVKMMELTMMYSLVVQFLTFDLKRATQFAFMSLGLRKFGNIVGQETFKVVILKNGSRLAMIIGALS
jgi:hypothetical protein